MTEPVTREAGPFADVPVADYVRDAVGALLLLMSLSLPWDDASRAADRVGVVLATLVALVILAVPYAARVGIMPAGWTVRSTRTARLVAVVPYAVVVALAVMVDLSTAGPGPGLGTAAGLGLAGAALAAQPRACELGPVGQDAADAWTTRSLTAVGAAAVAIAVLGVVTVAVSGVEVLVFLAVLVAGLWLVALLGWPLLAAIRGSESGRMTLVGLGVALVAAAVLGSGSHQLPHVTTFAGPGPIMLLLPLAGALAGSAAAARSTASVAAVERWVEVAGRGLTLLGVTAGAVVVWAVLALASGLSTAGNVVALVLGLLILAAALFGRRALGADAVQGRLPALAAAGLAVIVGSVLVVVDGGGASTVSGTAQFLAAFGLPGIVLVALTVPRDVREFFRENRPAPSTAAYQWQARATGRGAPETPSESAAAAEGAAAEAVEDPIPEQEPERSTGRSRQRGRDAEETSRITPVEPERSGYAARPGLSGYASSGATEAIATPDETATQVHETDARDDGHTQVIAPVQGFSEAEACDPTTPLETLARIAAEAPSLRPLIAENPSTYPALLDWLDRLGDPAVDAALARRASRS